MDFILSLTHFCEVHGPTSIICSQVLPFSCAQCHGDTDHSSDSPSNSPQPRSPANFPGQPESKSPKIEDHPYFLRPQQPGSPEERANRAGSGEGDTCASCSLSLPEDVSKQLPSPTTRDGKVSNGSSPVLRSREVVYSCGNSHSDLDDDAFDSHSHTHASPPDSLHSSSLASDASCHTHMFTYLSLRGPPNPADYALLRRSSIRTLSCELLPRGLSAGPICFGDSVAGYTIAYIFRLPDPMARGKRRSYALVALAGKDAGRAFRACPIIWRAFGRIASSIVNAAERFQEDEKKREEANSPGSKSGGSRQSQHQPVSSFLTGRAFDPAGQPRRMGQIRARNLAEIVGNEYIFTELHAHFVALLQQLGSMFGGVPISDEQFVCSTVGDEESVTAEQPVLVSTTDRERAKRSSSAKYDGNALDVSKLDISGPKPIPITPRQSVVA
ncbi:hypothetical protein N7478_009590 [Penicillium angulare]|uniref:uncharacterized protein n=1 Tax=Penicillium angulare TaxID=116970 RepID=UPI002542219B|nr:uncharacterized protein N7478_009590 [Penicillium angulare]KAJ5266782.1 hypothetical protein N7478_009590 [Penicillium angulare]